MLNYFHFGIFLTTLGIVSVTNSVSRPPNDTNFFSSPYFQRRQGDRGGITADRGQGLDTNILKNIPMSSNSDAFQHTSKQHSFSFDELDQIEAQIRNLKGMGNNKPKSKETVLKCIKNGQSRIINEGDKCDGALQVSTKFFEQDRPQPVSTSENSIKSPLLNQDRVNSLLPSQNTLNSSKPNQNHFNLPSPSQNTLNSSKPNQNRFFFPLNSQNILNSKPNQNVLNLPSPSQNILNSSKLNQNNFKLPLLNEDSSKPFPLNKYTSNFVKPASSFNHKKDDKVPSKTKDSEDYSDLAKLFDIANGVDTNDANGMMQAQPSNPSQSEGTKLITRNGQQYIATMPEEKPVQMHFYEKPVGLTKEEVHDIRNQVFKQANLYRQRHGCSLLTLNENMNNHAQEWANYLAPKRILRQRNSDENNLYGETLYASTPTEDIGKVAVDTWYHQLRFIHVRDTEEDLHNNPNVIGHMIQLLWKKSREMGIGVAKSGNGDYFIVADYNPKGDVYPFLLDNLPKFEQKDIDAAKKAHEASEKTMTLSKLENDRLGEPVTNSNSANGVSGSQKSTSGSPIAQSNDPNESPTTKELGTSNGVTRVAHLPEQIEPISFVDAEPLGLSRDEVEQIRKDVLAKSNYYRQQYGFPPLVLHKEIDHYAQDWANTLARTNQFKHRFNDGSKSIYGENIHRSPKILHLGEVAVDLWYYEVGLLHVDDDDEAMYNNDDAGHVTQLLWKSSKQMGVGAAVDGKGNVIVVANYNPKGNAQHFYLENVPRFTQQQIDEGKRLQQVINELKSTPRTAAVNGQLVKLPRWNSKLYNN